MSLRPAIAAVVFLASVPACAGVAAGAVYLGDALLGDTVPYSCGKRGLAVGLMGIWGVVLFGFLMGQVDRLATWIAPLPGSDPVKDRPPVLIGAVRGLTRSTPHAFAQAAPAFEPRSPLTAHRPVSVGDAPVRRTAVPA